MEFFSLQVKKTNELPKQEGEQIFNQGEQNSLVSVQNIGISVEDA